MRRTYLAAVLGAALALVAGCSEDLPTAVKQVNKSPAHVPSFATVQSTLGATFTTDKDDYSPGETLRLSGSGWQAADGLDIHLDETPQNHAPVDWAVTVDGSGSFADASYVVQDSDAGVTFTITATSRATGDRAEATFTDAPLPSGSLCADAPGAGTLVCPSPATTPTTALNSTHYKQQVGTSAKYEITGVTGTVLGTNGCPAGEVAVQIQSTPLGNSFVCGSIASGTISFTWNAPANGCLTTVVSYATTAPSGFTGTDNDIIADGADDGAPNAVGGIAYVDASGNVIKDVNGGETGPCAEIQHTAADLTVSKTAAGSYNDTFKWGITKAVDKTLVEAFGGTATFNYTVTVTHDGGTISNVKVTGTITVGNSNADPVNITSVTDVITDASSNATTCTVTGGGAQTLSSGNTNFDYSCDFGSTLPAEPLSNVPTVTWPTQDLSPSGDHLVGSSAHTSVFSITLTQHKVNSCVNVTDTFNNGSPATLGTPCDTDASPLSYQYSHTVNVPTSGCVKYDNTATFTATDDATITGSASKEVEVCGPAQTGALTMGFWQNKNGQAIITNYCNVPSAGALKTFLTAYNPFKDLTATTCSGIATYVTTIIKAANASGAAMNAMLKGQMLATALDVYFSDPALGGNKISAPAPIGGGSIDLTKISATVYNPTSSTVACQGGITENVGAAFGGATSKTVGDILTYAANQSNSGGSSWYGQVKATQELAKDTE